MYFLLIRLVISFRLQYITFKTWLSAVIFKAAKVLRIMTSDLSLERKKEPNWLAKLCSLFFLALVIMSLSEVSLEPVGGDWESKSGG